MPARHLHTPVWFAAIALLSALLLGGIAGALTTGLRSGRAPAFTVQAASSDDVRIHETFAPIVAAVAPAILPGNGEAPEFASSNARKHCSFEDVGADPKLAPDHRANAVVPLAEYRSQGIRGGATPHGGEVAAPVVAHGRRSLRSKSI